MSEWKPFESAPKDGSVFIAWRFYPIAIRWTGDNEYPWEGVMIGANPNFAFMTNGYSGKDRHLSHWKPLDKEPPK